jgi:hypothetical protein
MPVLSASAHSHLTGLHTPSPLSAEARREKIRTWMERLHKLKLSRPRGGEPVDPEHGRFTPDQLLGMDQVWYLRGCLIPPLPSPHQT